MLKYLLAGVVVVFMFAGCVRINRPGQIVTDPEEIASKIYTMIILSDIINNPVGLENKFHIRSEFCRVTKIINGTLPSKKIISLDGLFDEIERSNAIDAKVLALSRSAYQLTFGHVDTPEEYQAVTGLIRDVTVLVHKKLMCDA